MNLKLGYVGHFLTGCMALVSAATITSRGHAYGLLMYADGGAAYLRAALFVVLGVHFLRFSLVPKRDRPTWPEVLNIPLALFLVEAITGILYLAL